MAGLEPANQPPRVGATNNSSLADARKLGGRVKPAHGEVGVVLLRQPDHYLL
jgi:hypothetical protein